MEVNAQKIKAMRSDKGWTQQHLADACSISLRTVQRVERYGTASNETAMGLCAVFEVDRGDIVLPEIPVEAIVSEFNNEHTYHTKSHVTALAIGMGIGSLVTLVIVFLLAWR
ncbi:helix-turn-helix transcriptional regulator [Thalassotalea fusca]